MIEKLLTAASIPARAARFPDPPATHAIYFDSVDAEGPDCGPHRILYHNATVELYAPSIEAGDAAMARLVEELDAEALPFSTQGWYWLDEIRRYQEIIEFTYTEKT
jgi:hypothetical protein